MRNEADCSVVIVAGGFSRRFGRDKANALWDGRSMINHVAARVRGLGREIIAVCRAEQERTDWDVDRVIHDDPGAPEGPLRGVVFGLEACATEWVWVLSCDAPGIRPELLLALRQSATPDCLAVAPLWAGCVQPLTALYRTRGATALRAALESGERSPRRSLERLPHVRLAEAECRRHDPQGTSFLNVNRPQDLESLQALANGHCNLQARECKPCHPLT